MKKLFIFISLLITVLCLCGCVEEDFSLYYNLDTFKGIEVYCWEYDGEWRCGAMSGTNRIKTKEEILFIQNEHPCSLKEMNKILHTYSDEARKDTFVIVVDYPQTDELDEFYRYGREEIPETYYYLYSALGLNA